MHYVVSDVTSVDVTSVPLRKGALHKCAFTSKSNDADVNSHCAMNGRRSAIIREYDK